MKWNFCHKWLEGNDNGHEADVQHTRYKTEKLMAAQPVKKFPKAHHRAHNGTEPHPEPDESHSEPQYFTSFILFSSVSADPFRHFY
jgi:hypothetical protein